MFLFALLLWIVDDLLPWFLPKRLHDLVSGLVHSANPLVYLVKSLPVTSTLYEWMVQVSQGPKRMEELCAQNRLIHARLQEIQNSLLNVAEQVNEITIINLSARAWTFNQSFMKCKSA